MIDQSKYLITGSGGFLGRILTNRLREDGAIVIGLDRNSHEINRDITVPFELDVDLVIDTVLHLAGKAHSNPKTEDEKQLFFDVNFQGTRNLCDALEKLAVKPKAFIFFSTVAVYGVDSGAKVDENHPLLGNTPYAKSKILAEEWLTKWAAKHNILLGILRLPLVAGVNPPGNLGSMIRAIRSGSYLSVGNGSAQKSIVWGEDISNLVPYLAKRGGIFNITDGQDPSFAELESAISRAYSIRNPVKIPVIFAKFIAFIGDLIGERFPLNSEKLRKITSSLTFDDSKAIEELSWKPSKVLEKLIERL